MHPWHCTQHNSYVSPPEGAVWSQKINELEQCRLNELASLALTQAKVGYYIYVQHWIRGWIRIQDKTSLGQNPIGHNPIGQNPTH